MKNDKNAKPDFCNLKYCKISCYLYEETFSN